MSNQTGADQSGRDPLVPTEPVEPFFDELDAERRTAGRSCCTVWTLGLGLIMILAIGLWVILAIV